MENPKIQEVIEKQVLTVAQAVEDKLDEEIAALERLDMDDLEALRERRLQQMKKMAEKRSRWISLGHGEYSEVMSEKDFFSLVKASDRVVCHFYRENWPCKVQFRLFHSVENSLLICFGENTLSSLSNLLCGYFHFGRDWFLTTPA